MNDLDTLRVALTPDDPAQDVVDRSRHRLLNRMRGGRGTVSRTRWLAIGTGVTVTAVAAAVAVTVLPANSPPAGSTPPNATSTQSKTVTGQEVLLAAATAAERAPEGAGTYWYIKVTLADDQYEYWTDKSDGRQWFRGKKTKGEVWQVREATPNPFVLFLADTTLAELRALPTDPVELQAAIAEIMKNSDARSSAGPLTASDREMGTFYSLVALVSTLPAPPEVRAAAFRAIAEYPGVESLGEVPGGQGLLLSEGVRLVVDPRTGRMNGASMYIMDGAVYGLSDPKGARISAEWTDSLPK